MATLTSSQRFRGSNLSEFIYRFLLYGAVLIGAIVFAIPFYWMLRTALMPSWQVYRFPPEWIPAEYNWQNFRSPFAVFPFGRWFLNSGYVAVVSAVGTALSASLVGFSFARLRWPLRDFWFVVVLATMILPNHVRLIPSYLIFVKLGWIDTYWPLIIPNLLAPAFFVFLMRQFFMTIPPEYDDAAYIDGCNPFSLYWRIHMPLSLPAMGVAMIFQFNGQWNDFLYPLLFLHRVNDFTIALGLRLFQGQLSNRMQELMAAALLATLPTVLIFFVAQRYFIQGIVISGVKG